jgi:hypothetical protein
MGEESVDIVDNLAEFIEDLNTEILLSFWSRN